MVGFNSSERDFSAEATSGRIDALEKTVNDLSAYTRRPDIYPFDTVAGEIIAKSFALCRCAILMIERGYGDEAFGLCRSLYESAIYLRYITREPNEIGKRADKFLEFGLTSKAFWFDLLDRNPSLTQEERDDIERYKAENRIPDDPNRVTQPWSGVWKLIEKVSKQPHPVDAETSTEEFRAKGKAIAYTDTSSYVHCTQAGLNGYSFDWTEPILVPKASKTNASNADKACMLIQVHLKEIVRYCLFGMNIVSLADLKGREHADQTPQESGEALEI